MREKISVPTSEQEGKGEGQNKEQAEEEVIADTYNIT